MPNLPKLTLSHDKQRDTWNLKNDKTSRVIKKFDTKENATKGGALERALGPGGGSVKIKTIDGRIQEERTYPGNKDPKKSPG